MRLSHRDDKILYFPVLSNEQIKQEEAFKKCVQGFNTNFLYHSTNIEPDEFIRRFIYRHPDVFWLSNSYRVSTHGLRGIRRITPIYAYSQDEVKELQQIINRQVRIIISGALAFRSPFERIIYIYEWFTRNIKYYDNGMPEVYNIVGALRDHRAVCAGIAKAFMLVCLRANIPCGLVTGNTGPSKEEKHCWNIVKIGHAIYHVDVTSGINCFEQMEALAYPIFMLPESELLLSRYIATPTLMAESLEYKYTRIVEQCFSNEVSLRRWLRKITMPGSYTISGDINSWESNEQYQNCVRYNVPLMYVRGRVLINAYDHYVTVLKFL